MAKKNDKLADLTDFLLNDEFVAGICKPGNSEEYINALKLKHPDKVDAIDYAIDALDEMKYLYPVSKTEKKKAIWKNILAHRTKNRRMAFVRIAASFILLAGIGGVALYLSFQNEAPAVEKFAMTTQPSYDQSQLILSDGQQIMIADYDSKVTYSSDGSNVVINDCTEIVQEVKAEAFNQMIVPYGKFNSLQLSDGTKVWVNSGSRLIYPPVFTGKTREVYVQGEAYFEVEKDKTRPFFVRTDQIRVEVSGTRFSVLANEKEGLFTTLLLEGEVTVSPVQGKLLKSDQVKLVPGQIASLKSDMKNLNVAQVEHPENQVAWKNGYLIFRDEPIDDVIQRLSRFYNITVKFKSTFRTLKISGKLDLKDDPERVLKGVATIARSELVIESGDYIMQ